MKKFSNNTIATNRKANFNYEIKETYEAGIVLKGTEVKSLRRGSVNIKEGYCVIKKGEILIFNMHIAPYEKGNIFNKDPLRIRKLLMHKKEIENLFKAVQKKGFSIIPLSIYLKKSLVKVKIGLCRGKKLYDKRQAIAKKDANIKIKRNIKQNFR